MALTGLHTNWLTGSYAGDREYMLRVKKERGQVLQSYMLRRRLPLHGSSASH